MPSTRIVGPAQNYPQARMAQGTRLKDQPASERPRERLVAHGADALSHAELIGILLRTGFKGTNAVELGNQQATQSHTKATPKLHQSHTRATPKPTDSQPIATPKPPSSHTKARGERGMKFAGQCPTLRP